MNVALPILAYMGSVTFIHLLAYYEGKGAKLGEEKGAKLGEGKRS